MPKRARGLTAAHVRAAKPGRYGDGGGLYLLVRSAQQKFWVFRWVRKDETRKNKMREMGLGPAAGKAPVSLADARNKAEFHRRQLRDGLDPLVERERAKVDSEAESRRVAARSVTFKEAAEKFIAANESGWRNAKHRAQWETTLKDYVFPHFGELSVADIDVDHILGALDLIWKEKPETASRVRGRIESVLDFAKVKKWRSGENPARWRGHLNHALVRRSKIARVIHHPAMPYSDIPGFLPQLRAKDTIDARALEFAILNAARTGAVLGATWAEIDLDAAVWTVPPERAGVKINEEMSTPRRVPLAPRCIEILRALPRCDDNKHVFIGAKANKGLGETALRGLMTKMGSPYVPHGFRSAFKDWCAEQTNFSHEISEAALWHAKGKLTEAYQRGDLLDKRRKLMEAWARYCAQPVRASTAEVVPMRARG